MAMLLRVAITAIAGIVTLVVGAVVVLLVAFETPSTTELDADLGQVSRKIGEATKEAANYSSGFLLTMIELRLATLKTSEALLSAKRASLLRRITLVYTAEGKPFATASAEALRAIEQDIEASEKRVREAAAKADMYTGGLVQAMALLTAETERLTHSQLLMRYYAAKYGLLLPVDLPKVDSNDPSAASPRKIEPLGKPVKDRDAI